MELSSLTQTNYMWLPRGMRRHRCSRGLGGVIVEHGQWADGVLDQNDETTAWMGVACREPFHGVKRG